jgi:hypothetical protein
MNKRCRRRPLGLDDGIACSAAGHPAIGAEYDVRERRKSASPWPDYFPKVGLSTFVGGEGLAVTDTVQTFGILNILPSARPVRFIPAAVWNRFYRERQAFWDETVAQYKQKVLIAFQETSDALVAQRTLADRRRAFDKSGSRPAKFRGSSVAALRERPRELL